MGLFFPPALSVGRFTGGYKSQANYRDLADTETSDSQNVEYMIDGNISKRKGSLKLNQSKLYSSTDTTTGRPITGYYYFAKSGSSAVFSVAMAGDSIYSYTSSSFTAIRTVMSDNSNTFWSTIQIQDPRSASDDILIMSNGVNPIQVWNGSATAIALSSFTSATQVPIAKYILNHKERVYAFNIIDSSDADASTRVFRTGFGSDGQPDPHRFTENFYVGGSSRDGDLRNGAILNDQIIFYKRYSIWKFATGVGITDIQQVQDNTGILAPRSLVATGDFHIFLSDRGVLAFDGNSLLHLSEKVDKDLFEDANFSQLHLAKAVFDYKKSQYIIYYPGFGSLRNNRALIYDLRPTMKYWQPPVTGRQVNFLAQFDDSTGMRRVIYGDYKGYLYEDGVGLNDGIATGYNGTVQSATFSTLTDATQNFITTNDGLIGLKIQIVSGAGEGQERLIQSNTSATITLETDWTIVPDATSEYSIGGIDGYWRSKDYSFGSEDLLKLFRHIKVRTKEEGNFALALHYIVDFNDLARATKKDLSLLQDGFAWNVGAWDQVRWGGRNSIQKKISLRNTSSQGTMGNTLAVRFSNAKANQSFQIQNYELELREVGKR